MSYEQYNAIDYNKGYCKMSKWLFMHSFQNNGHELLWTHVQRLYDEDSTREIRRTKLTFEHIHLSPQSVMHRLSVCLHSLLCRCIWLSPQSVMPVIWLSPQSVMQVYLAAQVSV